MAAKKSKGGGSKISKIKLKNIKGKKLSSGKKTKSKEIVKARRKLQRKIRRKLNEDGSSKTIREPETVLEDVLEMIPSDDLSHLRNQNFKNTFYLVKNFDKVGDSEKNGRKKKGNKRKMMENEDLEDHYEERRIKVQESMEEESNYLPIKTKKGLQFHRPEKIPVVEDNGFADVNEGTLEAKGTIKPDSEWMEENSAPQEVTTAMLLARRKMKMTEYKVRIGTLSSSFLEDPENRLQNLESLLAMMGSCEKSVALVVPKLIVLSLQAIFAEVLPLYPIKHHNDEGVKLKKDTRQLQTYEASLLKKYKIYMQKLEKLVMKYCPKKSRHGLSEAEQKLGKIALMCMCRMLESHPYFNLSVNIVNFVVPILNNWDAELREIVTETIRNVFRMDKRGEISYEIVRRINVLVKTKLKGGKMGGIRNDVIDVLLFLRIKEADLEKEKEEEATPGRKMTFEQRRMLSKRQRKKAKELVQLEKELLEASAEESKSRKSHFLTEITKLVFTIYFRTLKTSPRSTILSSVLEGLSKFAHVINIEYFQDLLVVLQGFLKDQQLKERQFLLCISTVLAVLDGQGSALTLDPTTFHKYLYGSLVNLTGGKLDSNVELALRCVRLATGKKKMPSHRAIAFVKRLATLALQVEHHDSLGVLQQIKFIMRLHPTTSVLLDCDGAGGSAVYLPELEDPDHSGAQSSTLWELLPLMSHYHPWVSSNAIKVVLPEKPDILPANFAQMHPEAIPEAMNVGGMEFIPKLKVPNSQPRKSSRPRHYIFKPRTDYLANNFNMAELQDVSVEYPDFNAL